MKKARGFKEEKVEGEMVFDVVALILRGVEWLDRAKKCYLNAWLI